MSWDYCTERERGGIREREKRGRREREGREKREKRREKREGEDQVKVYVNCFSPYQVNGFCRWFCFHRAPSLTPQPVLRQTLNRDIVNHAIGKILIKIRETKGGGERQRGEKRHV